MVKKSLNNKYQIMYKSIILLTCFFIVFLGKSGIVFSQNYAPLLPQPVEVKSINGNFLLSSKTKIVVPSGNKEIREVADLFSGQLASLTGQKPEVNTVNSKLSISFRLI